MTLLATALLTGGTGGLLLGYAAGHLRLPRRVLDWADDQSGRPRWHPFFLLAVPLLLTVGAVLWTCRPHRTAAKGRAWSPEDTLTTPLPGYAPKRPARRSRAR